eukprot:gene4382-14507_t
MAPCSFSYIAHCIPRGAATDGTLASNTKVLRKHGAKLGLTPDLESHMIFQCVMMGNKEKLESYLKNGASPNLANVDGRTALHIACRGGQQQMDLVDVLLDYGAQPSTRDKFGRTPLLEAVDKSRLHVLDSLLDKEANLNLEPSMELRHMMHIISTADNARLGMFLRAGADPNLCGGVDWVSWFGLIGYHCSLLVKELVEYGANIHQNDKSWMEPIDDAQQVGAIQVVEYLQAKTKACTEKTIRRLSVLASVMQTMNVTGSVSRKNSSLGNLPSAFDATCVLSHSNLPEDAINDKLEREMHFSLDLSKLKSRLPNNVNSRVAGDPERPSSKRAEYRERRRGSSVTFYGSKALEPRAANSSLGNLPSAFDATYGLSHSQLPEDAINDKLEREMRFSLDLSRLKPRLANSVNIQVAGVPERPSSKRAEYQERRRGSSVTFSRPKATVEQKRTPAKLEDVDSCPH